MESLSCVRYVSRIAPPAARVFLLTSCSSKAPLPSGIVCELRTISLAHCIALRHSLSQDSGKHARQNSLAERGYIQEGMRSIYGGAKRKCHGSFTPGETASYLPWLVATIHHEVCSVFAQLPEVITIDVCHRRVASTFIIPSALQSNAEIHVKMSVFR